MTEQTEPVEQEEEAPVEVDKNQQKREDRKEEKEARKQERETRKAEEEPVPDYAHVILVPLANPETAPWLLRLAYALIATEGGRIIALSVVLGDSDAEANLRRLSELEGIVGKIEHDETVKIDFVTRESQNTARGILDAARESGAELILLGLRKPERERVEFGQVAESVIETSPCDVLVYRHSNSPQFGRVLIPVDGSPAARMAVRMGIMLGNGYGVPVEAIYVQSSERPDFEGHARIEQSLANVRGRGVVKRNIIPGRTIADGLLGRCGEDDMIILGFSRPNEMERWLFGNPSRRILDMAPGPVLLAARQSSQASGERLLRRTIGWVRPKLTDVEQETIIWRMDESASPTLDYVVLTFVSSLLASLGLLLNSSAVIIGAMLVAPLMGPLTAFGVGLATARMNLVRRATFTTLLGAVLAFAVSYLTGLLLPLETPTAEMMSRVSPSLLDAGVAIASGIVGGYATARKDIPAALAGVAIAAALVPPVCTFGLQLSLGSPIMALGALLLFLMNIVSIAVVSTIVFYWLGMKPVIKDAGTLRGYVAAIIFVLLTIPVIGALLTFRETAVRERNVVLDLQQVFEDPAEVVSVEIDRQVEPILVVATIRTPETISQEMFIEAQAVVTRDLEEEVEFQVVIQESIVFTQEATPTVVPTATRTPTTEPTISEEEAATE